MAIEYRYELKYMLSKGKAALLKQQLKALMYLDSHSVSSEYSYQIRSILDSEGARRAPMHATPPPSMGLQ